MNVLFLYKSVLFLIHFTVYPTIPAEISVIGLLSLIIYCQVFVRFSHEVGRGYSQQRQRRVQADARWGLIGGFAGVWGHVVVVQGVVKAKCARVIVVHVAVVGVPIECCAAFGAGC